MSLLYPEIRIDPVTSPELDHRGYGEFIFLMLKTELPEVNIFTDLVIKNNEVKYSASTYEQPHCTTAVYQGLLRP